MVKNFTVVHGWPIDRMIGDHEETVYFPVGKSDRMYVYLSRKLRAYCYLRQAGKYKVLYRVRLTDNRKYVHGSVVLPKHTISSLYDEFTHKFVLGSGNDSVIFSSSLIGSIFAKNDLKKKQDFVQYIYDPPIDAVSAFLVSYDPNSTAVDKGVQYCLDIDPITKEKLSISETEVKNGVTVKTGGELGTDRFYEKYGLPLLRIELDLLSK